MNNILITQNFKEKIKLIYIKWKIEAGIYSQLSKCSKG